MANETQSPKEASEEAQRVERISARRLWNVTRVLAFAVTILVVVNIAFAMQTSESQDQLDVTSEQVAELKAFVDDLIDETPSEAARNAAITEAVQEVPRIKSILCEAFPGAAACSRVGG